MRQRRQIRVLKHYGDECDACHSITDEHVVICRDCFEKKFTVRSNDHDCGFKSCGCGH